ncbi:uncharacterized protein LOC131839820 [Mustela lutreola]|uniref:uncharacterized protein LOC131839820 n=1 Tax=Mustela lutreola TaxID=9666 RepID=UPI0027971B9B|nr:uncharacterized protein LOC131839820 [Mustela lutreola]
MPLLRSGRHLPPEFLSFASTAAVSPPPLGSRACTPGPEQPPACPPLGPKQACEVLLPGDPRNELELKADPRGDTRYGRERPDRKRDRGARRRSGARAGAARAAAAQSRAGPVRVRASGRDVGTLRRSQVSQGPGRESTDLKRSNQFSLTKQTDVLQSRTSKTSGSADVLAEDLRTHSSEITEKTLKALDQTADSELFLVARNKSSLLPYCKKCGFHSNPLFAFQDCWDGSISSVLIWGL